MNRVLVLFSVCLIAFIGSPVRASDTATALEKGIQWYERRDRGGADTLAREGPINQSIRWLRESMEQDPSDSTAALYLLKAYYFKGTFVDLPSQARREIHQQGKTLGARMTRRYPESVPIRFWYAVNLGRWAEEYGVLAAAREGVAGTVRNLANEIIEMDPDYRGGAGYSLLGQVHYKTPYIPFFLSWPSDKEAITLFEKALEIKPNIPLTYYYYARVLHDQGRTGKSLNVLGELVDMEPRKDHPIEDRWAIYQGRDLLRRWSS